MKTIAKTLVTLSILVMSIQAYSAGNINSVQSVHYKVNIHLAKIPNFDPKNLYVVISDGKGLVAEPQHFRVDNLTYEFSEKGTVTGTRIAMLVYMNGGKPGLFNATDDVKTGRFLAGNTYDFNLYIQPQNIGSIEE
jgi:hypothetical protein